MRWSTLLLLVHRRMQSRIYSRANFSAIFIVLHRIQNSSGMRVHSCSITIWNSHLYLWLLVLTLLSKSDYTMCTRISIVHLYTRAYTWNRLLSIFAIASLFVVDFSLWLHWWVLHFHVFIFIFFSFYFWTIEVFRPLKKTTKSTRTYSVTIRKTTNDELFRLFVFIIVVCVHSALVFDCATMYR